MPAGRPLKFQSVDELQDKIDDYFATEGKDHPTVTGLALHLDTDRQTLINYQDKPEYFDTIKRAKNKVEAALERYLYGNSVTGLIFNLKNNFDWKDKTETDVTTKGESINPNPELAAKFADFMKHETSDG